MDSLAIPIGLVGLLLGGAIGAGAYAAMTRQNTSRLIDLEVETRRIKDKIAEHATEIAVLKSDHQGLKEILEDIRASVAKLTDRFFNQQR